MNNDIAFFGGGCFWCTEAQMQLLKGVTKVVSGYMGGFSKNPSYEEVCTGRTGHAEMIQVSYDSDKISYTDLLHAFFKSHDPTTLNRQGNDSGTQYRSVIFYANETQHQQAKEYIKSLTTNNVFDCPIVTELSPASTFYPAEQYHQDYYNRNESQSYCAFVINPKLQKFKQEFSNKLKSL